MGSFDGDPDHSILPEPWRWELLEFTYRRNRPDLRESYIDMVFAREGKEKRLRFFSPQSLELSQGLPNSFGMCILDVSGRQLDDLRVRVANFEHAYCAPLFWAARVVEVTE